MTATKSTTFMSEVDSPSQEIVSSRLTLRYTLESVYFRECTLILGSPTASDLEEVGKLFDLVLRGL